MFVPGFAVAQGNKLTDPQIAHIAYTAGQIDIQAAQLALKKSKSKEVRDFATQMERDHKAVNDKALALLNKLKVKPEDNETSRTLTRACLQLSRIIVEAKWTPARKFLASLS